MSKNTRICDICGKEVNPSSNKRLHHKRFCDSCREPIIDLIRMYGFLNKIPIPDNQKCIVCGESTVKKNSVFCEIHSQAWKVVRQKFTIFEDEETGTIEMFTRASVNAENKKMEKVKSKKTKKKKTLLEENEDALNAGMTYGKYQASKTLLADSIQMHTKKTIWENELERRRNEKRKN